MLLNPISQVYLATLWLCAYAFYLQPLTHTHTHTHTRARARAMIIQRDGILLLFVMYGRVMMIMMMQNIEQPSVRISLEFPHTGSCLKGME